MESSDFSSDSNILKVLCFGTRNKTSRDFSGSDPQFIQCRSISLFRCAQQWLTNCRRCKIYNVCFGYIYDSGTSVIIMVLGNYPANGCDRNCHCNGLRLEHSSGYFLLETEVGKMESISGDLTRTLFIQDLDCNTDRSYHYRQLHNSIIFSTI